MCFYGLPSLGVMTYSLLLKMIIFFSRVGYVILRWDRYQTKTRNLTEVTWFNLKYGKFEIFTGFYVVRKDVWVLKNHTACKMSTPACPQLYGNYGGVLVMKWWPQEVWSLYWGPWSSYVCDAHTLPGLVFAVGGFKTDGFTGEMSGELFQTLVCFCLCRNALFTLNSL